MPVYVAITRRVKAGREAEFQEALRGFFQASLTRDTILGVQMLTPPPGSTTREYGILRSFASDADRDSFYSSALFKEWEQTAAALTEGKAEYRQLHGLEGWFRSGQNPPPRWKMAIATFLGVFPLAMVLGLTVGRATASWNFVLKNAVFNFFVVGLLTWVVMPIVTRLLQKWLRPEPAKEQHP